MTRAELAKKAGIPYHTLTNRLREGWGVEKALAIPSKKYKKIRYFFEGEDLSLMEVAKKKGINCSTLYHRIFKQKMPVDDAVTKPVVRGGWKAESDYKKGAVFGVLTILNVSPGLANEATITCRCVCGRKFFIRYKTMRQTLRKECRCVKKKTAKR